MSNDNNMSDQTRQKVGITPRGEMDDAGNALGVRSMVTVIDGEDIYKDDPILKAERELLRTQHMGVEDDPFTQLGMTGLGEKGQVLEPTYNMVTLTGLSHQNNTLLQAVSAMEVNIDGTGYELARKDKEVFTADDEKKAKKISEFFDEPWPGQSFITIRRALRRDLETTGNGFIEVIRNNKGDIVFLRHIDAMLMRFMKLEDAVPVSKKIKRGGSEINVKVMERPRKYVQKIGDTKVRFFKDFGIERDLHAETGEWLGNEPDNVTVIPDIDKANELLHFSVVRDVLTPYGVPRWINNLPSVLGSRKAEEFNLEFFDHGGLPPAMILIQGGQLSNESRTLLTNYLSGKAKTKQRGVVTEIFAASGDLGSAGNVKVSVERFGDERQKDAMFATYDANCAEHVRISFRLPPMFLGLSEAYNFACYDALTETLTDSGWIKAVDFQQGMKVAQVDSDSGELQYVYPSALSTYAVEDVEMHNFKSQTTDICVTPKHRMLWRDMRQGDWRVTPIEELNSRCQFKTTVDWKGGERLNIFEFPAPILSKHSSAKLRPLAIGATDFLQMVGWLVSDGHVAPDTYVAITQHKDRHWDEICALADRLPVRNTYVLNGDKDISQMCLADITLHRWARDNIGKGVDKQLPDWMLNLPKDQLEILFDTMMKGDGTVSVKGTSYCTTSPRLRDQVQEIALKLGYRAKAIESAPGTHGHLPVFRILLTKRESTDIYPQNVSRDFYTGDVHCFTVPSGVYVTRRNGCVAIQGNTAYTAYMIAEAQVFLPERDEFDEMLNLTIMKELSDEYVFRSKSLNVVDVEAKLKAMELSKEYQNPTDFIDELNEIVRANFTAKEGIDEQIIEADTALIGVDKAKAETSITNQGNQGGAEGRVLKVDFDDVIRELADDWSGHLMGTLVLEDASVKTMSKLINTLDAPVRKLFDGYVGMKMSSGGLDDDGVAELMACVGHRHEGDSE